MMNLKERLSRLPKIDLHRHLEGSLRLETIHEIAREHNVNLQEYSIDSLRPLVQIVENHVPDFHTFMEKFYFLHQFYSSQDAIKRIAYEAVIDAAEDNIKYLELRFSPYSLSLNQSFSLNEVMEWVIEAVDKAQAERDIMVRLIVTIVREFSCKIAWRIARTALTYAPYGVVGLDLAGDEVRDPMEPFADIFKMAREAGLGITVHAGEARRGEGAESVRKAVELFGAQRIGHGVRAGESPDVVALLRDRKVTLEICPTSNFQTGVVLDPIHHPSRDMHRQGVLITINTDDPSISDTTLTDEYCIALREMGITLEELKKMILNGVRAAFLPQEEKDKLEAWFRRELDSNIPTAMRRWHLR